MGCQSKTSSDSTVIKKDLTRVEKNWPAICKNPCKQNYYHTNISKYIKYTTEDLSLSK